MYKKNDDVYIYFGDLKATLPYRGLNPARFGKIISVEEVSKNMYNYIIRRIDGNEMLVKQYDNSFNICSIEELLDNIYGASIKEDIRNNLLELVNDILRKLEN